MKSPSPILDVRQFIDERPFSRYQWGILVVCFLLVAIDTYDSVTIGFVVPVLAHAWSSSKAAFGTVMSAGILGLATGALIAGPLFDRTSPKTVIVGAMVVYGMCSIGTMSADSVASLGAWRFFTGVGVGAAAPGAATLMYEYAPARMSAFLVNAIGCGALIGASMCGLIAAVAVPAYGWQSLFLIGGVLPLALAMVMVIVTPQPLHFMIQRGFPQPRIAAVLRRIAPDVQLDVVRFVLQEAIPQRQAGVRMVLSRPFRMGTVMLWSAYFFSTFAYYLLLGWLPTLIQGTGATLRDSSLITVLLTLGGIIGTLLLGRFMDRFEKNAVIAAAYAFGGAGVWLIGRQAGNLGWIASWVFIAGIGLSGALLSMSFLAAAFYPAGGRSTGIAWMHGVGRLGGFMGPMAGAAMLRADYSFRTVFTVVMAFVLLSAAALMIKRAAARRATAGELQTESA
ncbi:MFS transporter [Paraburkholderia sp. Tr-20389]|uniref:MFS transporter n=1 Tax=Paraburkholderia sp. Tr-20389 TaxID=2703903 RepID=UPI00197E23E7|nr:MFS transporter [Paraburkholderia sp. Tr-20389]MBN3755618.1 MFS transporter [Paraburkholderia sp. Tr-20389]